MKSSIILAVPPPPPPPPAKTAGKTKKGAIAAALIAIIIVATVVLFYFNVIPWPFKSTDNVPPTVTINTPLNTTYSTSSVTINATVADTTSGVHTVLAEIDNSYNVTLTKQASTDFYTKSVSLSPDGSHHIRIYANDTLGNAVQSQSRFFTINTSLLTNYGVVMGKVTDTLGSPLSNVNVTVGGKKSTTNDQGWFSIANVTGGTTQVVTFQKGDYATTYRTEQVQASTTVFTEASMGVVDNSTSFGASSGATITTSDGGSIKIGANSLVNSQNQAYTGTADIAVTTFDPSDEMEANAFPGEYVGISAQNETVPIKSYGFMDIVITTPLGETLNLALGKAATIRIPVPASMQAAAQTLGTCPLWYFNSNIGSWYEEGSGIYNVTSGCFVGNVTHFSTWNYDIRYPAGYISGRVIDSGGNPVQGAQVRCWGRGWYQQRWASGETYTLANGTFKRIPVEVGVTFKYQASKGGHNSAILQAGPLSLNQEYDVGDIILDSPIIQVTLTWGENPSDLDSHLTARLAGNTTFHVYYGAKGSLGNDPYANLDTDDTTGYGPEVVSISRLRQGTYRYSVRHYSGSGDIATSGAEINVIIPGVGLYRYVPPSGQPQGTDIWRVFDIVIDAGGRVTSVNLTNDYVTGGDNSDLLYPP